jgi:acyl-CoA thioesterase
VTKYIVAPVSLDHDTALTPSTDGAYEGVIGETWWTPRGPLGGYVMAIVLRGMMLAVDEEARQPRSFTVHFLRPPTAGPITVRPVVERVGRSLTSASARLEQDGKLIALALGAFSLPYESPRFDELPMPEVAPPEGRAAAPPALRGSAPVPPFMGRLTMQGRFGDPPFTGSDTGLVGGWLGLLEERPIDALAVTLLADAWFPAPWPRLDEFMAAPTIDLSVHFRSPLPIDDGLLLGRFQTNYLRDGFFEEDGTLWAQDGTFVAQSRQLGLLLPVQPL